MTLAPSTARLRGGSGRSGGGANASGLSRITRWKRPVTAWPTRLSEFSWWCHASGEGNKQSDSEPALSAGRSKPHLSTNQEHRFSALAPARFAEMTMPFARIGLRAQGSHQLDGDPLIKFL